MLRILLLSAPLLLGSCAFSGVVAERCDGSPLCDYDLIDPAFRWPLPAALDEASGLAELTSDSLLSHNDNDSTQWRLRLGEALAAHPVSDPDQVIDGDFEGVAVLGSTLFALSSRGLVYRAAVTESGVVGPLAPVASGVAGRCNFEGIAAVPGGVLYLACKYPLNPVPNSIRLFRLAYGSWADAPDPVTALEVDVSPVVEALGVTRLRPSGLAWLQHHGRLLVLAGKERVLLDVDPHRQQLVAWRRLSKRLHRQPEGLSLLADGSLAIVDEADGRVGTLTIYAAR